MNDKVSLYIMKMTMPLLLRVTTDALYSEDALKERRTPQPR